MRNTLVGEIPAHQYVFVESAFTHREPIGFVPAVWFGLVGYPGRAWGLTVMLESGAIYRNLPPHAIAYEKTLSPWEVDEAQHWDVYGWDWTALEYAYLRGLECLVKVGRQGRQEPGRYLFTVAPVGDAFSAYPDQAKEFSFIRLDNGRLTIQPTNHVVFMERSFTVGEIAFPSGLKRQDQIWTVE